MSVQMKHMKRFVETQCYKDFLFALKYCESSLVIMHKYRTQNLAYTFQTVFKAFQSGCDISLLFHLFLKPKIGMVFARYTN